METCVLARRRPVYRGRDSHLGFRMELGNLIEDAKGDAEARLAVARLHHAGVGSQIRTFARMDAMASDKTAKSERLLG